ncbi:MAG: AAA family ATPase, partial [Rubrivivax sp.]|nr:AAA family ATPase [Rubrivivax sp.]
LGIHTGRVLLGAGVDAEHGIRGMTVNIAARLEQAAAPGTLLISHDTWRQVEGLFDCEALPPLQVKGRDEPLAAWRVLAARPPGQAERRRGIDGVASPFTGRAAELARLLAAWATAAASPQPQALLVLADAGLGKSRLAAEFLQHVAALDQRPALLLQARAQPGQQLQPYRLLRDLLARWLAISDSDDADTARARFEQGLRPWLGEGDEALAAVHRLGALLGLDHASSPWVAGADARLLRDWGLQAFEAVLAAVAERQAGPLLLVADDLHWADAASVQALERLLPGGAGRPLPLLLLGLARPHAVEEHAALAASAAAWTTLALAPLSPADGTALVATLLQRLQPLPDRLAEELAARAAGNPYYLEELVKMLLDQGVIEPASAGEAGAWRFHADRLRLAELPPTLAGVLQSRLDALPPLARRALQQASIIGPVFWDDALARLDAGAPGALPELEHKALVQRRPLSAFEGTVEEQFAHQLLQQVSYDTVLKRDRQAGHAAAARWLAQRGRSAEHLAGTARHFLLAGEREEAAAWFLRASLHASQRFDNATALALIDQGLQAVPPAGEVAARLRWPLHYQQMLLADRLGDRALQEGAVRGLEALAGQAAAVQAAGTPLPPLDTDQPHNVALLGPEAWPSAALYARGQLAMRLDRFDEARALLERAIAGAEAAGQRVVAAEACNLASALVRVTGDAAALRDHVARGLTHARALGHRSAELRLLTNLATLDYAERRHAVARRAMAALLPLARELNQGLLELVLTVNLTGCDIELARPDEVLALAPQALRLAERIGERMHGAAARLNLAEALHMHRRLEEAAEQANLALRVFRESHSALYETFAEHNLAEIENDLGRHALAAQRHAEAARRFAELGQPGMVADAHARRAASLLALGDAAGARAALAPVVDEDLEGGLDELALGTLWEVQRVLTACGDAAAARWRDHGAVALKQYLSHFDDPEDARRFLQDHEEAAAIAAAAGLA